MERFITDLRSASAPRYRWYHAAAVGLCANAVSARAAGVGGDQAFYSELKTPPGSPPGWLFGPVWLVNNVTTLWSNLQVANMPRATDGRRTALAAEASSWLLFASFTSLYFGLRSPKLGALNTVAGLGTTALSVAVTARIHRRAAWGLAPRLAWLVLAAYVSVATAARNPDPIVDPLLAKLGPREPKRRG